MREALRKLSYEVSFVRSLVRSFVHSITRDPIFWLLLRAVGAAAIWVHVNTLSDMRSHNTLMNRSFQIRMVFYNG